MIVRLEEIYFHNDADIWADRYYNLKNIIHYHKEIELIHVKEGRLRIYINTCQHKAKKGDIIVCNSGDIHSIESIGTSVCDILIFNDDILKKLSAEYTIENHIPKEKILLDTDSFIKNITYEINAQNPFYKEVCNSEITNFFAKLYRHFGKAKTSASNLNKPYQELISYIDLNYDKVTFSEAADIMHYTKTYFSKVFKDISGMTFTSYLNIIRIEKAIEKIKGNSGNITEIANECGFSTIRHFNRTFKEITGTAPSKITGNFVFAPTKINENMKTQQYNTKL